MERTVEVVMMSGVEDGLTLRFDADNGDGLLINNGWTLTIGRREDCDVCLRNDTFISRHHAQLHWRQSRWWLEDCDSKNGTFIEDTAEDARVSGTIPIEMRQLFRVGRTWMCIQPAEQL